MSPQPGSWNSSWRFVVKAPTLEDLTLGTLYSSGVGINKTKQHSEDREEGPGGMEEGVRGGEFMDGAFCSSILVSPHLPASQFEE